MASRWRMWRGWIIALVVTAAAVVAWRVWSLREVAIEVRTVAVARGRVEALVSSTKAGAIRSRRMADLSVDSAGTIVAIHRREGERVEAGEHLLSLDSRDERSALDGAQRELEVLRALVPEARARLDSAVRELERLRGLLDSGSITRSNFDLAEAQANALKAVCTASEARVTAQEVAVERAKLALEKRDLHAPFAGVVAERWVEEGEWAMPGKQVFRLLDPASLYVRAELDEIDLGGLAVGQPARVRLDPYRGQVFDGRVVRVAPYVSEIQEQNRTVEVEVELEGQIVALALKPGTSADVDVIVDARDGVLAIPTTALLEGSRVLVVEGARARERPVEIGLSNWDVSEITAGLGEGERVIVSLELEAVKDGVLVRASEPAGPRWTSP